MPEILGYEYAHFRLSAALTNTVFASLNTNDAAFVVSAVNADDIDFTTPAVTGVSTGADLADEIESFAPNVSISERDHTSIGNRSMRTFQGRDGFEATISGYLDDADGLLADKVLENKSGHRLLYAQYKSGAYWVGVVDIFNPTVETENETGRTLLNFTIKNSGKIGVTFKRA